MIEIVVALGLFAVVATALMSSIAQVGELANTAQQELSLSRLLESHANKLYAQPQIEEGTTQEDLDDFGDYGQLTLLTEIEPMELTSMDEEVIQGMYSIKMTLSWFDGVELHERSTEFWRYQP